MGGISVGSIVFVSFPFSDLSNSKKRPAVVLAKLAQDDLILCQITSKSYSDKQAIRIDEKNFAQGGLIKVSYIRPNKLFTANLSIIQNHVAKLNGDTHRQVVAQIVQLLQGVTE